MALAFAFGLAALGWANNVRVENTTVLGYQPSLGLAKVGFDISWDNSWRYTNINHDAVWVFFKVRGESQTNWQHVRLAGSGINPAGYSTGTGTGVELIVPSDGMGLFVRRSGQGSGPVSVQNLRAVWNFATNGFGSSDKVVVKTMAIEMVYVAEGAFYAGSGGGGVSEFYKYPNTNDAYRITNEGAIAVGTTNGNLYYASSSSGGDRLGPIPAAFPKGYAAFYCMKYEVTQGQYADFLNTLSSAQAGTRNPGASTYRYTITGAWPNFTAGARDRACNWLSWADLCAYADWSGLRPMSELEYEKACRGPLAPVADEYAWGSTGIVQQTGHAGTDGSGTETALPTNANCCFDPVGVLGPVRAGIYATASSSREGPGLHTGGSWS